MFLLWAYILGLISIAIAFASASIHENLAFSIIVVLAICAYETSKKAFPAASKLLATAFSLGILAEWYSLKYGSVFGAKYLYTFKSQLDVLGVPIQVGIFWAVFYYLSHNLVNTLFNRTKNVFKLALLDASIMTIIDLFLDPIMAKIGVWKWITIGPYFGIPLGNFVGWFLVSWVIAVVVRKGQFVYLKDTGVYARFSVIVLLAFLLLKFYLIILH